MELSSWPRHQLRAQSRLKRRSLAIPSWYLSQNFVPLYQLAFTGLTHEPLNTSIDSSCGLLVLLADQIAQQAEELSAKGLDKASPIKSNSGSAYDNVADAAEKKEIIEKSGRKLAPDLSSTLGNISLCTGRALPPARLKTRRKFLKESLKLRNKKPHVESLPHGRRLECFADEVVLVKDALGRVVEIKSSLGPVISIQYDNEGRPHTFLRTDEKGRLHSIGERNNHGVVVKDPSGKVRACGESIAVDPHGTLSVHRFDGQFFSIDLVRGVHIERRCAANKGSSSHMLTAVFALDGFRMMTRFQLSSNGDTHGSSMSARSHSLHSESDDKLRFYGRDGSAIQFESEEELKQFIPAKVWPPGSKHIKPHWRGYYQAGTAWESVQEYILSYLATVS